MFHFLRHIPVSAVVATSFLFLAASCSFDEEGNIPCGTEVPDVISVSAETPSPDVATKAKLEDGTRIIWESNDKISVVGSSSTVFTLSDGAGTSAGKFSGTMSAAGSAPYFAVMPSDDAARVSGGGVTFRIPQKKGAQANNIAKSAVPMAGVVRDDGVQFHNLFGLLKMTFTSSPSVTVKKITLHDLGGNMLWGDCFIPVKADTLAYNDIVLSGGDNTINMVWTGTATFSTTPKSYYFAVPPGALDRGFSMVLYEYDASAPDGIGRAYTFIQKVSDPVSAKRSVIINIDNVALAEKSEPRDVKARGYYKTLFVDAGPKLSNYYSTSHFKWLTTMGLVNDYEYFAGDSVATVIGKQASVINRNSRDANGVLLYPDGEPRFRMTYCNGGKSSAHGRTLYMDGRRRFHDFYHNGGSYVGTCAGGFLARTQTSGENCYDNADSTKNHAFGIWPGTMSSSAMPINNTDYPTIYTAQKMLASFGPLAAGDTIEQVKHHGGFYIAKNATNNAVPHENLMSYQYTEKDTGNPYSYTEYNRLNQPAFGFGSSAGPRSSRVDQVSLIAYKKSDATGRALLCGSHPERETTGKKLQLMETMVKYALEGNGDPDIKSELTLGTTRDMSKKTADNDPGHTGIGDRQYHHFIFRNEVAQAVRIQLSSKAGVDLYLALRKDGLAWMSDAEYVVCSSGGNKTFDIKSLPAGTWYVSVYCPETIIATPKTGSNNLAYFEYGGKVTVLDGVAYSITVGKGTPETSK